MLRRSGVSPEMPDDPTPPPNWAAEITGMVDQSTYNEISRLQTLKAALEARLVLLEAELHRLGHEYE